MHCISICGEVSRQTCAEFLLVALSVLYRGLVVKFVGFVGRHYVGDRRNSAVWEAPLEVQ